MRNDHPLEQEELMAYLDGELSTERAAGAAVHLERCRECQATAADLQGVSRRMLGWQVEDVSAEATASVAAAMDVRGRQVRPARKRQHAFWWAIASAAAMVVAVVVMQPRMRKPSSDVAMSRAVGQQPISGELASRTPTRAIITSDGAVLPSPMIVHTGELILTTREFDKARAALDEILKRYKGFVGRLDVNSPPGSGRTLKASLRIPAAQRETARAELKKLGRVESESQSGEEVTQEYMDLDARLSNARNTERRLSDMLRERTGKLPEVLAVELEIDRVRGEIERMEASKKNLMNRVDFATLNVTVTEEYKAQAQVDSGSALTRFRNAAIAGYHNLVDLVASMVEFLLSSGPILLLGAAILFFPVRRGWRRWHQR